MEEKSKDLLDYMGRFSTGVVCMATNNRAFANKLYTHPLFLIGFFLFFIRILDILTGKGE